MTHLRSRARSHRPARPALLIAPLVAGALLMGGCGAQFSAPGRGDLAFAASRVQPGEVELTVSGLTERAWQGDLRLGLGERDALEVSLFGRDGAGERYGMALGGVSYRRWLMRGDDPIHLSVGAGAAAGVGGWNNNMSEDEPNHTPAAAAWVDIGALWPVRDWLGIYAAGRVQGASAFAVEGPDAPPPTLWLQAGAGARVDLGPAFFHLGYQFTRYDNALSRDWYQGLGFGVGWRM